MAKGAPTVFSTRAVVENIFVLTTVPWSLGRFVRYNRCFIVFVSDNALVLHMNSSQNLALILIYTFEGVILLPEEVCQVHLDFVRLPR